MNLNINIEEFKSLKNNLVIETLSNKVYPLDIINIILSYDILNLNVKEILNVKVKLNLFKIDNDNNIIQTVEYITTEKIKINNGWKRLIIPKQYQKFFVSDDDIFINDCCYNEEKEWYVDIYGYDFKIINNKKYHMLPIWGPVIKLLRGPIFEFVRLSKNIKEQQKILASNINKILIS